MSAKATESVRRNCFAAGICAGIGPIIVGLLLHVPQASLDEGIRFLDFPSYLSIKLITLAPIVLAVLILLWLLLSFPEVHPYKSFDLKYLFTHPILLTAIVAAIGTSGSVPIHWLVGLNPIQVLFNRWCSFDLLVATFGSSFVSLLVGTIFLELILPKRPTRPTTPSGEEPTA